MKRMIVALLLASTASSAFAHDGFRGERFEARGFGGGHGYYGGSYYRGYNGWGNFVAPALIGGMIGYGLAQPRYVQPAVVYTQPPVIYSAPAQYISNTSPMVYSSPPGYHYENILDANCNCYRTVLIGN